MILQKLLTFPLKLVKSNSFRCLKRFCYWDYFVRFKACCSFAGSSSAESFEFSLMFSCRCDTVDLLSWRKLRHLLFGCRSDRETTPCSLIRNSEAIETPGSTTQPAYLTANQRQQLPITSSIPSEVEMERLFAGPEQLQQRRFMEKYTSFYALDFWHDSTYLNLWSWILRVA